MRKIVPVQTRDGVTQYVEFEGHVVPDAWDVFTYEQNGVRERSARAVVEWVEVGEFDDAVKRDALGFPIEPRTLTDAEAAQVKAKNLKRAARRAKTMCRRVIIGEAFDEMLTLTYRENQPDRALCKKHFKEWYRRMKRALGTFRFCASFEVQQRGSMHVHVATHKLPSHALHKGVKIEAWRLGTAIWRDIVGADNGLCFVGAKTRFGRGRRRKLSLAKMASYVSKYIMKDYEDAPEDSHRYSRSVGTVLSPIHKIRLQCTFRELVELTFEAGEGDVVVAHRVGYFKDSVWFCCENPSLLGCDPY